MIAQLKKILPNWLKEHIKLKKKVYIFKNKPIKETFTYINENQIWNNAESVSGNGSELAATHELIKELNGLIKQRSITSMLDIPCGDFNWMQHVNLNKVNYIGGDIVETLIKSNTLNFGEDRVRFQLLDLTQDALPKVDLVFCRDCLVHLSYKDIYKALVNIKKSNSTYLLTTSFYRCNRNQNIITGQWRKLNFEIFPFYFSKPLQVIDEKYTKRGHQHSDKVMAVWKISDIKIPFKLKLYNWLS